MANDLTGFSASNAPTQVNVQGIDKKALNGIVAAINNTNRSITRLTNDFNGASEAQKKAGESEKIRSLARDRNDRATAAALHGEIDKGITGIETLQKTLKNALDKLTDIVSDMAKNALKSYDQTVRGLREVFMSTVDMKTEMIKADRASQKLREKGIVVTSQQTKQTVEQMNKAGFDSRKFSEEQVAAITVGMKSGLSLQAAVAQSQRSKDQIALAKTFATASQQTGRETFKALSEALEKDQTAMAVYMKRTGKVQETATADILTYAQQLDSVLGGYLSNDEQAKILQQMMLLNSKQLDKLNQPFADLLGISPDAFKNASNREELMTQGIYKMIQSGNVEYLNVLKNAVGQNSPLIDAVSQAQAAYKAGNYKLGTIYEDETKAIDAFNKNNPGGEIGALIDGLMTDINTFTDSIGIKGGIFGGLAAEVNELFGDSVGMEDIVTTGFKETLKILKAAASNGWGGTAKTLAALFGGGATGFGAALLSGASGPLAGTMLKTLTGSGVKGLILNGLKTALAPIASAIAPIIPPLLAIAGIIAAGTLFAKWVKRRYDEDVAAKEAEEKVKKLEAQKKQAEEKLAALEKLKELTKTTENDNEIATLRGTIKNLNDQLPAAQLDASRKRWKADQNDDQTGEYVDKLNTFKGSLEALDIQRKAYEEKIDQMKKAGMSDTEIQPLVNELDKIRTQYGDLIASINQSHADVNTTGRSIDMQSRSTVNAEVFKDLVLSGAVSAEAAESIKNMADAGTKFYNESKKNVEDEEAARKYNQQRRAEMHGPKLANGGIFDAPINALIGEAGKEVVLPLTRPDRMHELLSSLTNNEKSSIISAINASNQTNNSNNNTDLNVQSNSAVPGNDAATINKILSYSSNKAYVYDSIRYGRNRDGSLKSKDPEYGAKKREAWYQESLQNAQNREGYDLIKGTWAERALAWGASQIGLPYLLRSIGKIGYVCNELTNAALLGSGFDLKDFRIHGVKTTFANISSGKMVSGKDRKGRMREYPAFRLRPDITPENAVPGMIFFQDSSKNKDGQFAPGHVGLVYYGHQRLHSAGGSGDYSGPDAFLNKYQTPCRGVTVNEFDKNARYQFGELPGLFEQASGDWEPPKNATVEFGPTDINKKPGEAILNEQNDLSKSALSSVIANVSKFYNADMQAYAKQTANLASTNNTKEIVSFMEVMVKYLRDIANAPANRRQNVSPSRPVPNVY